MTLPASLRQLPPFDPPPGGWPDLARRLDRPARAPLRPMLIAAAASAVLASAVTLEMVRLGFAPGVAHTALPAPPDPELAQLMRRSQELETVLSHLRPQTDVWDAHLQARTERLERGLSYVDLQLNYASAQAQPDQARRLWENRVELMTELVATHRNARLPDGAAPNPGTAI